MPLAPLSRKYFPLRNENERRVQTPLDVEIAAESLKRVRRTIGSDDEGILKLTHHLKIMAEAWIRDGRPTRAEGILKEAISRLTECRADYPTEFASIFGLLAGVQQDEGKTAAALENYQTAIHAAGQAETLDTEEGAMLCLNFATLCAAKGEFSKAELFYKRGLITLLRHELSGENVIRAQHDLGMLYLKMERPEDALLLLEASGQQLLDLDATVSTTKWLQENLLAQSTAQMSLGQTYNAAELCTQAKSLAPKPVPGTAKTSVVKPFTVLPRNVAV